MAKSRKSKKQAKRRPNLSPLSMLRPRLDGLWGNPDWPNQDDDAQQAELTAMTKGIEPGDFLPVMAKAYAAAPAAAQQSLDRTIPGWLEANEYVDDLREVVEQRRLPPEDLPLALAWLQATGLDTAELAEEQSTFYRAFIGGDDLGSQGLWALFWYSSYRRDRVRGISVLIDYNPPWEGAVKDVTALSQAAPETAVERFLDLWEAQRLHLDSLDEVEAKKSIIEHLLINRREGIRLHRDIAALRDVLVRHLFTLPDGPETPPFIIEDFDELAREGKSAESFMIYEQTVGRRVRMEDGTEIVVIDSGDEDFLTG